VLEIKRVLDREKGVVIHVHVSQTCAHEDINMILGRVTDHQRSPMNTNGVKDDKRANLGAPVKMIFGEMPLKMRRSFGGECLDGLLQNKSIG